MTARKPRLFSFGRETELAHIDMWAETPEEREVVEAVVDAFIEIARTRKLRGETLRPIADAAAHPSETVRALAITRLVVMAHYFEHARTELCKLVREAPTAARPFLAAALVNAPAQIQDELLPELIADPDAATRRSAIPACVSAEKIDLLRHQLTVETDERVRQALEHALA